MCFPGDGSLAFKDMGSCLARRIFFFLSFFFFFLFFLSKHFFFVFFCLFFSHYGNCYNANSMLT